MPDEHPLDAARRHLPETARHARTPYSGRPEAALLLLADGRWVPGARVESASFSLVIPALLNAYTTAVAADRRDVVAVVLDHPRTTTEDAFVEALAEGPFEAVAEDAYATGPPHTLPSPRARLNPFLDVSPPDNPADGVRLARRVARRAHVPLSAFPVGCLLELHDGRLVPGVNVEHTDWARILCAERNALGTAVTYGVADAARRIYLSCAEDPSGTPCGACRQLLLELAPEGALWMDRGDAAPAHATPAALLPGGFTGARLACRPAGT